LTAAHGLLYRPLLQAFANTHASVTVKEQTEFIETVSAWAAEASAAVTKEVKTSLDISVGAFGYGVVIETGEITIGGEVESGVSYGREMAKKKFECTLDGSITPSAASVKAWGNGNGRAFGNGGDPNPTLGVECWHDVDEDGGWVDTFHQEFLELSFSYTTSVEAAKCGPPSDAFLVPSVWFEVVSVWYVRFGRSEGVCTINGQTDVSLKANAELSGFAFTTANDVETRTLPLLADQASELAFRLSCHTSQSRDACCRLEPPSGADAGTEIDDASKGCKATNLVEYCDFKYAPRKKNAHVVSDGSSS